jgi:hypothetical protein
MALICLVLLTTVAWATESTLTAPQAAGPTVTVKGATLNVRAGPGTNYAVIGSAKKGQTFEAKGRTADSKWIQICCVDAKTGWVSAPLVTVSGDIKALPVPKDIPAPSAAAKPAATGGKPAGTLMYSVVNWDADRWELWEYNFTNGKSRFLKEWRTELACSSNCKLIAFYGWDAVFGEKAGIYIANPDLSGERLLLPAGDYPSFAPGGDRLAVQGGGKIWVVASDGQSGFKLTDGEYPAWNPTDNWIAHRACFGPDCGIWLTYADSGEHKRLTTGGGDGQPAWSPDGKRIAYISKDDGNFEIYVINSDGSGKTRLTNTPQSDGLPIWSPDGRHIAFRSDRDGKWAIYVMKPDGTGVTKVVDADVFPLWFLEKMAWRP